MIQTEKVVGAVLALEPCQALECATRVGGAHAIFAFRVLSVKREVQRRGFGLAGYQGILEMFPRQYKIPSPKRGYANDVVGLGIDNAIGGLAGQFEQFLPVLLGQVQMSAHEMGNRQCAEHRGAQPPICLARHLEREATQRREKISSRHCRSVPLASAKFRNLPMAIIKEFREFIARGNVIDLAVGVIIGASFSNIVKSFTDDVIMPVIGKILGGLGGLNFKDYFVPLDGQLTVYTTLEQAQASTAVIAYGSFLTIVHPVLHCCRLRVRLG